MPSTVKNLGTYILLSVFGSLLLISGYLIVSSYTHAIKTAEHDQLERLKSIASTAVLFLDGDKHEQLVDNYIKKDAILSNTENVDYQNLRDQLLEVYQSNDLHSPIYTLVYRPELEHFCFVVTSAENPYYMHSYESFPQILKDNFNEGGVVPQYKDEHGVWLSAFAPLKNSKGQVVAVLQVDQHFEEFISNAQKKMYTKAIVAIILIVLVSSLLLRFLRLLLRNDRLAREQLAHSKQLIENKNKNIVSSIQYAKRIQDAMLPPIDRVKKQLPNFNVFFKPRDIVSGDFYWFAETDDKIYIAAADCTGHGVPGAFLSLLGNSKLNEIIASGTFSSPCQILCELDKKIKKSLNQESVDANQKTQDGMDIALCSISKDKKVLEFAGAYRPLVYIRNNKIGEIKANKFPIGGTQVVTGGKDFTKHQINIEAGDTFYLFSDGFPDQFGGEKGKKYMLKNFKQLLLKISDESWEEFSDLFMEEYEHWVGERKQLDDILVIGIKF